MDRRNRVRFALACAVALLAAAWWAWPRSRAGDSAAGPASPPAAGSVNVAKGRAAWAPPVSVPAAPEAPHGKDSRSADDVDDLPLPGSLRDTDPPDGIKVDWRGRLIPTADVIRLFDYFLTATGEEPDDVLRARILRHVRETLPAEAAAEVAEILDDYLRLRRDLREIADRGDAPRTPEERWQWLREKRREYLGEDTAEALFGEQEQVGLVDLDRAKAAHDENLSAEERAREMAALEERLPEQVREGRREAAAPLEAYLEEQALRESGGSEEEIFAAREKRFGAAAAARLAELDRRRAEWTGRLGQYRAERDALLAGAPPGAQADAAALEALRARHFAADEVPRVRALDGADAGEDQVTAP